MNEGAAPEEERVVVSVSLERYYRDARALSYMTVDRRRRARWLAARLARRWSLPGVSPALVLRGHLLPPAERLRLLAPGDTIQVIPRSEDWFPDEDDLTSSSEDEASAQKRQISKQPMPMRQNNEHEVKDSMRSQNETPDGVAIEDASSTSSVVTQSDDLRALKRRALALLDHCAPSEPCPCPSPSPCPCPSPSPSPRPAHAPDGADAGVVVARQRRRRVRRRARRLPADPDSPPPGDHGTDTTDGAAEPTFGACPPPPLSPPGPAPDPGPGPGPGAVLMNGAHRGDTRPRLVRPLH